MSVVGQIMDSLDGGTVNLMGHPLPDYGYFVGGATEPIVFGSQDTVDHDALVTFLSATNTPLVGWWTDEETGKVYVEGASWCADYDEAERLARERHEIAFWDIERQREFRPVIIKEDRS